MTDKQWKLLEVLDHLGGMGTIEVCINFGEYDLGDSDEDVAKAWRLTQFVVGNLMRSLIKKGLAIDHDKAKDGGCGWDITDKGRELLRKREARKQEPTFEGALRDLPDCVDYDPLVMKTLNDLRWACRLQLDLIEEGQDSTEGDDSHEVRRWLKKYGRPQGVK